MNANRKLRMDKFILEYQRTGNAKQSAIFAGYSPKTADRYGYKFLRDPYVVDKLREHEKILTENAIADEKEVLGYLTDVLRGNQEDEVATPRGVYKIKAQTKDRLKAGELIGRHYAMWTDRREIDANIKPIQIIDDVPNEETGEDNA